jgi:class 3 adenylate cyclase
LRIIGELEELGTIESRSLDVSRLPAFSALDPEDVHAMLGRFYEVADEIVERFGGSIDKHIGDSVMAVFGAPVAHDDDPRGARRSRIHRAMPTLGGGQAAGRARRHRVGQVVASGLGGARHRTYTVIGNSVNLAARLLKLAGAGETVLGDAVHRGSRSPVRARSRRAGQGSTRR